VRPGWTAGQRFVSYDSDLKLPVHEARRIVPLGMLNPTDRYALAHWWYQLAAADLRACQLPDQVAEPSKPSDW
jgi:hypothetical protein